jgi:hypothetical protein
LTFERDRERYKQYVLRFPRFPIRLDHLGADYIEKTVKRIIRPLVDEFHLVFATVGPFRFKRRWGSNAVALDWWLRLPVILPDDEPLAGCYFQIEILQSDDNLMATVWWHNDCEQKYRRRNLRIVKLINSAVGKIINTFLRDARFAVRSPIRNRTNKFLGPGEKLISQYLGYTR